MTVRIHLDTDLGSDTDDLCALAMLLGWPGVELVGITTSTDPGGRRAAWVLHALELAGRSDVPVAAGAEGSLGGLFVPLAFPDYWPRDIAPRPGRAGAALDLLSANADDGATVVAIGPYPNVAVLEVERPGTLHERNLVVMGGHVPDAPEGYPLWGARDDFNVQQDAVAASIVFERCRPRTVPLSACVQVTLRAEHTARLRSGGPLARLIADQAEAHERDNRRGEIGRAYPRLPDDLLNFQYDPLACAVAAGWDGVRIDELPVELELRDGLLHMELRESAPSLPVVTEVDARAFEDAWMDAVLRAAD